MATCGSLQHIFETPLPENPTLIESLSSWIQPPPIEQSSFTEIFGELHFKENVSSHSLNPPPPPPSSSSSSSSSSFLIDFDTAPQPRFEKLKTNEKPSMKSNYMSGHRNSDSFSSMNSESLQLCTEGLGFESCDDVEDSDWQLMRQQENDCAVHIVTKSGLRTRRSNVPATTFPPPISSIGQTGKPRVCFKSFRHDGRFVLKEVRIPTQEILHACRQDGRLKLHFVQPDNDLLEQDEEDDDEEIEIDDDQEQEEKENSASDDTN